MTASPPSSNGYHPAPDAPPPAPPPVRPAWSAQADTMQVSVPVPGTIRLDNFVIRSKTRDLYDASRTDPTLGFEGSFAEFVDETIEAFFWMLGMDIVMLQGAPRFVQVAA